LFLLLDAVFSLCCSNTGVDMQTLLGCSWESAVVVDSSQFELSAVQFDATDISGASRKAQQILPFLLSPGSSASLNVYCTARWIAAFDSPASRCDL